MATRDYGLQNVIHKRLEGYIGLRKKDYSRFLGDKSKELNWKVGFWKPWIIGSFKRLKDR